MEIFETVKEIVQIVVYAIGGAIALSGIIDAASGYSNQSSGKMSEGVIKAVGGAVIVIIGLNFVPQIFDSLM